MDVDEVEQLELQVEPEAETEVEAKTTLVFYWKNTEFDAVIQN